MFCLAMIVSVKCNMSSLLNKSYLGFERSLPSLAPCSIAIALMKCGTEDCSWCRIAARNTALHFTRTSHASRVGHASKLATLRSMESNRLQKIMLVGYLTASSADSL